MFAYRVCTELQVLQHKRCR